MLILWIAVFLVALALLVKSADWLLVSAEKIGLSLGLSPFIVGAVIVGVGTSFPELVTSLVATFRGVTDFAIANAVGSNIANILLVIGLSAIMGRRLIVTKSLIDLDLPLLAIGTVFMLGIVWDRQVTHVEAILLVVIYIVYLFYTVLNKDEDDQEDLGEVLPSRQTRRRHVIIRRKDFAKIKRPKITTKNFIMFVVGLAVLGFSSKYLIDAVINLSAILNIATGVISIIAVAIGTSLPELFVSAKAALKGHSEVALGNIFGSNVFNSLMVIGLPGIFRNLTVDQATYAVGLPTMALATLLFVISGISRRIHIWEGIFYLAVYLLFVGKIFNLF